MNTGAAAHGPLALGTAAAYCSPMTEVYNQAVRAIRTCFIGRQRQVSGVDHRRVCSVVHITSGFPSAYTNIVAENGGSTGIVVDNVANGSSPTANQANIYFISQGTQSCTKYNTGGGTNASGNCAIKLTQTGLQ